MEREHKDLLQDSLDALKEEYLNMSHVNLVVCGKTGVGKSTLVNTVFREPIAKTGLGKPVTASLSAFEKDGFPLRIYDTQGLELNETTVANVLKEIRELIASKLEHGIEDEFIHCIWYVVNSLSHRMEKTEIDFIRRISEVQGATVPVILLLSQSINKQAAQGLVEYLQDQDLGVSAIVPVLAKDYVLNDSVTIPAFGLVELVQATLRVLPEATHMAFVNVQVVDINEKIAASRRIVKRYTTLTFGVGVAPIPVADAPLLIGAQMRMISQVTAAFGIHEEESGLSALLGVLVSAGGTTYIGRKTSSRLLSMIPGGFIVGSMISGATAALLTTAVGEAYIRFLTMVKEGKWDIKKLGQEETGKKLLQLLEQEMKKRLR